MELRRAILLFAVVLAIAAVVTVLSGGNRDRRDDVGAAPVQRGSGGTVAQASPAPPDAADASRITLDADRGPTTRRVVAGNATTVSVKTGEPGTVSIPALGLTDDAEPGTPATLDVLADRAPATLAVRFTPAGEELARDVGSLKVKPAGSSD